MNTVEIEAATSELAFQPFDAADAMPENLRRAHECNDESKRAGA